MKFLEQSFGGSTDSQISNGCDSSSPVLLKKTISVDATHHEEVQRLREKLRQSEKVRCVFFSSSFCIQPLTSLVRSPLSFILTQYHSSVSSKYDDKAVLR